MEIHIIIIVTLIFSVSTGYVHANNTKRTNLPALLHCCKTSVFKYAEYTAISQLIHIPKYSSYSNNIKAYIYYIYIQTDEMKRFQSRHE